MAEAGPGAWGNCRGAPGVDSDQEEVSSRGETSAPPFTPGFSRVGSGEALECGACVVMCLVFSFDA